MALNTYYLKLIDSSISQHNYYYIHAFSNCRDTMPCCEICKGMFFFFYCPLLPLFWLLEYIWVFARQKWRRHKRKKRYRALRAAKQSQKDRTYLLLDKYSRGKVEREILDFSKDLKAQRQKKKMEGTIIILCSQEYIP